MTRALIEAVRCVRIRRLSFRVSETRVVLAALPSTRTSTFGGDGMSQPTDTLVDEQVVAVDDMLRLVAAVAAERHRDPMKALADRLLDLRLAVRG